MFGLSFGELVMLLLVAVIVLGPKELPRYLRKAGQFAGQLQRMARDMRAKSGIDDVLRSEGIGSDIAEIRRLATFARGELGSIMTDLRNTANVATLRDVPASPYAATQVPAPAAPNGALPVTPNGTSPAGAPAPVRAAAPIPALVLNVDRAREYPVDGPDSYGALPPGAQVYEGQLPRAETASDGDAPAPEVLP